MNISAVSFFKPAYDKLGKKKFANSGPALLVSTFVWAMENNIPLHQVIPSLTDYGRPAFGFFPFGASGWNKALWRLYADLKNGVSLHAAFSRRMKKYFPEYFLLALKEAEKDGNLQEVLSVFAERLNTISDIRKIYWDALCLQVFELSFILFVVLLLGYHIVRNIFLILGEMTGHPDRGMEILFTVLSFINKLVIGENAMLTCICLITFIAIVRFFRKPLFVWVDELLIKIPFVKNHFMNVAMLELSVSMASYLAAGRDILIAFVFTRNSCRHIWLGKKLDAVISRVSKGDDWLLAWRDANINFPLNDLVIRNAAASGKLAEGFDVLAEWFRLKVLRYSGINTICLFILMVIFNALIVGLIEILVFQGLVDIVYKTFTETNLL